MKQALYRKYRPTTFSEVIGQPHIKKTLLNQLKSHHTAQAYLFCGPRGIGKTTMARLMAKGVNCLALKEGEPCNECVACKAINNNKAMDVVEIDAASNTGVDNVRDNIISNAQVSSSVLKYKVFIIDEVHMLSISAFNALLKTLEEPPKNVIFILATTEIHKVPATIISRCQRYDFGKVALAEIVEKLQRIIVQENIQVDLEVLQKIAKNSEGSARDAESLLSQVLVLDDKHITAEIAELIIPKTDLFLMVKFFELIAERNLKEAIELINKMVEDGVSLIDFNKNFLEFLRKLLLFKITNKLSELEYLDVKEETYQTINNALQKTDVSRLMKIIEIFLSKQDSLKDCFITQLPLELAVCEACEEVKVETQYIASLPINSGSANWQTSVPVTPHFSAQTLKKKQEDKSYENVASDPEILNSIKQKFAAIIKKIREKNHALALTFSIVNIVDYKTDDTLIIGVKYPFHKERLCDLANIKILEEAIGGELNKPVKIICEVGDQYESKNNNNTVSKSDNLDNLNKEDNANVWDLAVNAFATPATEENKS